MLFERERPGADYERLIVLQDAAIGLRAIIALHSTVRGPAFGGIRRQAYADTDAALADGLALAESMSLKCALAGLPAGGGKTVILRGAPSSSVEWPRVYAAVGEAIEGLGGTYVCGPDLGTGPVELAYVRGRTNHMNPERNDAAESTAAGVLAGLRAVWCHLGLGPSDPRRVVVQGLGSVGRVVARRLSDQGVRVIGADPDPAARALAAAAGVELAHPDTAHRVPCDVFMPCALGGGLTTPVARELHCRALCGSANNQLGDDEAAGVLRERNIVHAPDVIVSAGAVIEGVITVLQGTGPAARALVRDTIARLESTTAEVLREAEVRGEPPDTVARRRGRALLSGA